MGVKNNKYLNYVLLSLDNLIEKSNKQDKEILAKLKREIYDSSLTKKQYKSMASALKNEGFANPLVANLIAERLENIMFNRKSKINKQQSKNDAKLQDLLVQNNQIINQIDVLRTQVKNDMSKKDFISFKVHKSEIVALENKQAALKIQIDQLIQVNLGLSSSKDAAELRKSNKEILSKKNSFNENEIASSYTASKEIASDIEKKNDFIAENIPNALDDPEYLAFQKECEDFEAECKKEEDLVGGLKDEML